jgi:hypothetical protein
MRQRARSRVFADVVWWHEPRFWYGPATVTPNDEALRQVRAKLADLEQQEEGLEG